VLHFQTSRRSGAAAAAVVVVVVGRVGVVAVGSAVVMVVRPLSLGAATRTPSSTTSGKFPLVRLAAAAEAAATAAALVAMVVVVGQLPVLRLQ
jgi:hypothetical protein